MRRPSRITVYLQSEESRFARFLWFHNPKPNDLLLGISGLTTPTSLLDSEYPTREVTEAELSALHYEYKDAIRIMKPVDHITCHADGRFHIRTRDKDLYVHRMQRTAPLGSDTPIFLEFVVVSDQVSNYQSIEARPKNPSITLKVQPHHLLALRGMFAGLRYNLERVFNETVASVIGDQQPSRIHVKGETIQGLIHMQALTWPPAVVEARPHGTILSFKFPMAVDRYHIKSFLFR